MVVHLQVKEVPKGVHNLFETGNEVSVGRSSILSF